VSKDGRLTVLNICYLIDEWSAAVPLAGVLPRAVRAQHPRRDLRAGVDARGARAGRVRHRTAYTGRRG
jgi:hypothetical protein